MSFSEWRTLRVGDICNSVSETNRKKEGQLIFLNTGDIELGKVLHKNYSSVKDMPGQAKKTIKKDDILFSEIRPANGRWAFVNFEPDDYIVSTKLMVIRAKENTNARYLYHLLTSNEITKWLQHLAESRSGTFPQITFTQVADIETKLPPINEQIRISNFLDALENAIELNRKTNQTLFAVAQTLFKEMCMPKDDGLPLGWRIGTLGDIYKTTSGGTPSRSNLEYYTDGTIPWIKSKELNNTFIITTEEKITEDALRKSSAKKLPVYSVLVAMYGATVGEIGITSQEATCNQAVCAFIPNNDFPYTFIYQYLKLNKENIISRAVGSAQQNISQELLRNIDIIIPGKEIIQEFHNIVSPLFETIKINLIESQTIASIRDRILPKLLNGEVELN